jgi:hypothetical protein
MITPTVPTNILGGAAQSVKVVTDAASVGGAAMPVYGYPGLPSGGRSIAGAPAMRVKVIAASDLIINGGRYWLAGSPCALPVSSLAVNGVTSQEGGIAIPVYLVGGSL